MYKNQTFNVRILTFLSYFYNKDYECFTVYLCIHQAQINDLKTFVDLYHVDVIYLETFRYMSPLHIYITYCTFIIFFPINNVLIK